MGQAHSEDRVQAEYSFLNGGESGDQLIRTRVRLYRHWLWFCRWQFLYRSGNKQGKVGKPIILSQSAIPRSLRILSSFFEAGLSLLLGFLQIGFLFRLQLTE